MVLDSTDISRFSPILETLSEQDDEHDEPSSSLLPWTSSLSLEEVEISRLSNFDLLLADERKGRNFDSTSSIDSIVKQVAFLDNEISTDTHRCERFTGDQTGTLAYRLYALLSRKFTSRISNRDDSSSIFGGMQSRMK